MTYEAYCWGGPFHGQYIASPHATLEAVDMPPMTAKLWTAMSEEPTATLAIRHRRYNYERVAFKPLIFGVWVITEPAERREAIMTTIVEGLTAVWVLTRVASS